jgi:glycosyltransferase involved in cell wall biosynthesis
MQGKIVQPAAPEIFLTVVVPLYNEREVLKSFHARLVAILDCIKEPVKILYVDDGSKDDSWSILAELQQEDSRVALLSLSRNFGKEIALSAGLDYAKGQFVIIMDADLQHPPELIPKFIDVASEGYDMVYARAIGRRGETWLRKQIITLFYKSINRLANFNIPQHASDFRLLSRRAIESLQQIREQHRFMKGLFAWIGYPQKAIDYQIAPRFAGKTKWSYWKLWNFAIEGITSFSIIPLKFSSYLGLVTAFIAFIYGVIIIGKTLFWGELARGYPSLMAVILFLGGVQLFTLGIIGEYLGRTFNETKNRPLYFIKSYLSNDTQSPLGGKQ